RTAQGNEADLWLVGYITHSLKSVHLLEWSGQGFYRYPNKNCIAISSGAAASTVVVISKR
ncbi:hypothetical protein, partial [Salmonella enterica]